MNSVTISLIVLACVIGGALIGLLLGKVLPPNHLSGDSKDVVKVDMGLVGTMTPILLGLLVASAKVSMTRRITNLPRYLPRSFYLTAFWRITGQRRRRLVISCASPSSACSIRCGRAAAEKTRRSPRRQAEPKFSTKKMYSPFSGVVQISDAPLRSALAHLENS
jgi:hypothetical protein